MSIELVTYPISKGVHLWMSGSLPQWDAVKRQHPATAVFDVRTELRRVNENMALSMDSGHRTGIQASNWQAYDNIARGIGSDQAMDHIVTALNLSLVLAEMGFGAEYLPLIEQAQEGAYRAGLRGLDTDRWTFDLPTMARVKEVLQVHDAQLELASKKDVRGALEVIRYRQHNGLAFTTEPIKNPA